MKSQTVSLRHQIIARRLIILNLRQCDKQSVEKDCASKYKHSDWNDQPKAASADDDRCEQLNIDQQTHDEHAEIEQRMKKSPKKH